MSATTRAAPSSTSCRRGRSRSCRLRPAGRSATAPRSSGPRTPGACRTSSGSIPRTSRTRSSAASGCGSGAIALETRPQAHPLAFGIARRFAAPRLALLGDAAHVIHPIAGQGLNLGLKDAAALAESVVDAVRLGLDPGGDAVLAGYERARRFDTFAMGLVTDGLNRLFSNDLLPVRLLRDLGLGLVDRMPALKRFFIREAAGLSGEAPRLMRGEAL